MRKTSEQNSIDKIPNTKKGITLIALIITIVLMLILASITINVAINGGLFDYAQKANFSTEIAREKEIIGIATVMAKGLSATERVTIDEVQNALNNVANNNETIAMDNGDTIVVKFNKNNRYYEVDQKGKIDGPKELVRDDYAGDITKGGKYDGKTLEKAFQISCIEDLVAFSIMSNGGNSDLGLSHSNFENKYIKLTRTLDFNSLFSYNDYTTTKYGNLNTDKKTEDIRTELTKTEQGCIGFTGINNFFGIFDGQGYEIRNIYINSNGSAGLFLEISNATIQNLTITGEITATREAGGIASGSLSARNNTFINCSNYANVTGNKGVGGILRSWND